MASDWYGVIAEVGMFVGFVIFSGLMIRARKRGESRG